MALSLSSVNCSSKLLNLSVVVETPKYVVSLSVVGVTPGKPRLVAGA